jgi:hypothetical protein
MAITSSDDAKFKAYSEHVFKWEGLMDDDPLDRAVNCVRGLTNVAKRGRKGLPIHTVRGVTWCTFKALATQLGVGPVTHQRFVSMTKDDVRKFIFYTYNQYPWKNTPDPVAIALTETAWGSGPGRVWPTAIDTLKALNIPTIAKKTSLNYTQAEQKKIIADINKAGSTKFFDTYSQIRKNWLDKLGQTSYGSRFRRGWLNRQNEFIKLREKLISSGGILPVFFLALPIYWFYFRKK